MKTLWTKPPCWNVCVVGWLGQFFLGVGSWILWVAGFWELDFGNWALGIGSWTLGAGQIIPIHYEVRIFLLIFIQSKNTRKKCWCIIQLAHTWFVEKFKSHDLKTTVRRDCELLIMRRGINWKFTLKNLWGVGIWELRRVGTFVGRQGQIFSGVGIWEFGVDRELENIFKQGDSLMELVGLSAKDITLRVPNRWA